MARETIRTYVTCEDGKMFLVDTIEHEGSLWLVPQWLETPYPNMHKPVRIIRLPSDRVRDLGHDFLGSGIHARKLNGQVPKGVLDGTSLSTPLLDVQEEARHIHLDVQEAPELLIRRD